MKIFKAIVVLLFLSANVKAQGLLNSFENRNFPASDSYTEVFVSAGYGSAIGINHLKNLTPRTSVLIGASYTNFRMLSFNNSYEQSYLPTSFINLRSEFRYYLTPKEKPLSAFIYGAINNSFNNFPMKQGYNLGLEIGGEVRYKISENVSFFARTSFYRQNAYGNPYLVNPSNAPLR